MGVPELPRDICARSMRSYRAVGIGFCHRKDNRARYFRTWRPSWRIHDEFKLTCFRLLEVVPSMGAPFTGTKGVCTPSKASSAADMMPTHSTSTPSSCAKRKTPKFECASRGLVATCRAGLGTEAKCSRFASASIGKGRPTFLRSSCEPGTPRHAAARTSPAARRGPLPLPPRRGSAHATDRRSTRVGRRALIAACKSAGLVCRSHFQRPPSVAACARGAR